MKYFTAFIAFLFLTACTTDEVPQPAQQLSEATLVGRATVDDDHCPPVDCDAMIKITEAELRERAAGECGVYGAAITCCEDNQTVQLLYQLIANCEGQPRYTDSNPQALHPSPEEGPLAFDVRISECIAGGRTLEVVPDGSDRPLPKGTFEAHWWIDGAYYDAGLRIECVQGEYATLLIVDHADKDREYRMKVPLYKLEDQTAER